MFNKIIKVIKNPKKLIIFLASKGIINYDDEKYLKFVYKEKMNKELDLDNPKTYNEKLQWLKIHDRKDEYTKMVDKYSVREYIKETIGEEYLIPCLGVYNDVNEIDFDKLPNQFVLKTTHDSGTAIICKDKTKLDKEKTIKKLNKSMKRKYFYLWREWPYKNVKPRIIAEKYMQDENNSSLIDYKIYCFDGQPKMMFTIRDRDIGAKSDFYDMDFNKLDIQQEYPNSEITMNKPNQLQEMIDLCKILSKNIPHVRVDFYIIDNKLYFGELTFFDSAGMAKFTPEKYDEILGSYIDLSKAKG